MKYVVGLLVLGTFTFRYALAKEIKIQLKDSAQNQSGEVLLNISGNFEKNRYKIRPTTKVLNTIETFDKRNKVWVSNFALWSDQIYVEDLQKLNLGKAPDKYTQISFELLDIETSNKYITDEIIIFSNDEANNYIQALNRSLTKVFDNSETPEDEIPKHEVEDNSQAVPKVQLATKHWLSYGVIFGFFSYLGRYNNVKIN